MNKNTIWDNCGKPNPASIAVLASLLISVVAVTGGTEPATSQFASQDLSQIGGSGIQNQTQMAPENLTRADMQPITQNQTQMAPENLTRADMQPVTSALNSARDSLLGNGTLQDAYRSLNDADNALFGIAQTKGSLATKMSEPMRSHIEGAQQALLAGDAPKALDERNSAEVVLLGIIQGLPAEEEETSTEEEETSTEEEETSTEEEEE